MGLVQKKIIDDDVEAPGRELPILRVIEGGKNPSNPGTLQALLSNLADKEKENLRGDLQAREGLKVLASKENILGVEDLITEFESNPSLMDEVKMDKLALVSLLLKQLSCEWLRDPAIAWAKRLESGCSIDELTNEPFEIEGQWPIMVKIDLNAFSDISKALGESRMPLFEQFLHDYVYEHTAVYSCYYACPPAGDAFTFLFNDANEANHFMLSIKDADFVQKLLEKSRSNEKYFEILALMREVEQVGIRIAEGKTANSFSIAAIQFGKAERIKQTCYSTDQNPDQAVLAYNGGPGFKGATKFQKYAKAGAALVTSSFYDALTQKELFESAVAVQNESGEVIILARSEVEEGNENGVFVDKETKKEYKVAEFFEDTKTGDILLLSEGQARYSEIKSDENRYRLLDPEQDRRCQYFICKKDVRSKVRRSEEGDAVVRPKHALSDKDISGLSVDYLSGLAFGIGRMYPRGSLSDVNSGERKEMAHFETQMFFSLSFCSLDDLTKGKEFFQTAFNNFLVRSVSEPKPRFIIDENRLSFQMPAEKNACTAMLQYLHDTLMPIFRENFSKSPISLGISVGHSQRGANKSGQPDRNWLNMGGRPTIEAVRASGQKIPGEDIVITAQAAEFFPKEMVHPLGNKDFKGIGSRECFGYGYEMSSVPDFIGMNDMQTAVNQELEKLNAEESVEQILLNISSSDRGMGEDSVLGWISLRLRAMSDKCSVVRVDVPRGNKSPRQLESDIVSGIKSMLEEKTSADSASAVSQETRLIRERILELQNGKTKPLVLVINGLSVADQESIQALSVVRNFPGRVHLVSSTQGVEASRNIFQILGSRNVATETLDLEETAQFIFERVAGGEINDIDKEEIKAEIQKHALYLKLPTDRIPYDTAIALARVASKERGTGKWILRQKEADSAIQTELGEAGVRGQTAEILTVCSLFNGGTFTIDNLGKIYGQETGETSMEGIVQRLLDEHYIICISGEMAEGASYVCSPRVVEDSDALLDMYPTKRDDWLKNVYKLHNQNLDLGGEVNDGNIALFERSFTLLSRVDRTSLGNLRAEFINCGNKLIAYHLEKGQIASTRRYLSILSDLLLPAISNVNFAADWMAYQVAIAQSFLELDEFAVAQAKLIEARDAIQAPEPLNRFKRNPKFQEAWSDLHFYLAESCKLQSETTKEIGASEEKYAQHQEGFQQARSEFTETASNSVYQQLQDMFFNIYDIHQEESEERDPTKAGRIAEIFETLNKEIPKLADQLQGAERLRFKKLEAMAKHMVFLAYRELLLEKWGDRKARKFNPGSFQSDDFQTDVTQLHQYAQATRSAYKELIDPFREAAILYTQLSTYMPELVMKVKDGMEYVRQIASRMNELIGSYNIQPKLAVFNKVLDGELMRMDGAEQNIRTAISCYESALTDRLAPNFEAQKWIIMAMVNLVIASTILCVQYEEPINKLESVIDRFRTHIALLKKYDIEKNGVKIKMAVHAMDMLCSKVPDWIVGEVNPILSELGKEMPVCLNQFLIYLTNKEFLQ